MSRLSGLTFAQKQCVTSAGKLMQDTAMIGPGARVGVAVSGGADSWTLLQVLRLRRRIVPFAFELMVLHVNPGFDPANHAPLAAWLAREGLPGHLEVTDHGPRAHSEENRKNSPCFFCCWHRRKRLFELCRSYGLTHLALGHNTEDLVGTFFMNIFQTGRVDGMAHSEPLFDGELTIIRPLLWLDKETITRACRQWELPVWANPCPSSGATNRSRTMDWLAERWNADRRIKNNVYNALRRWQTGDREKWRKKH
ncbi:MAG: tRNA 2-thiocytidine biosynthesis protein TtcA [Desulfovibrionaceae bacterium]|jgi:tRNA(Ile)-lysidine synthase TilS/MesJ|nr:tRNA 2-thiocytidine biosynthesis protein TtcA [Desulfovibrionaceae bacterium]